MSVGMRAGGIRCLCGALLAVSGLLLCAGQGAAQEKHDFKVAGDYMEACSCPGVCGCEMTGGVHGCEGVGAATITSGSYNGVDLSGAKFAIGLGAGSWVRGYVDAKPEQRDAAKAFVRSAFAGFGKVESVRDAKIDIASEDGKYTVTVDGGKVMRVQTEPVLGYKGIPVEHNNVNNPLVQTLKQGKVVSGTYKDGTRSFTLKGTNAFFNDKLDSSGQI